MLKLISEKIFTILHPNFFWGISGMIVYCTMTQSRTTGLVNGISIIYIEDFTDLLLLNTNKHMYICIQHANDTKIFCSLFIITICSIHFTTIVMVAMADALKF